MSPDPQPAPRLWSTQDLADYLGVTVQTIHAMRRRGEGPPTYRVGKVLRFDPDEVRGWLHRDALEQPPNSEQTPDVVELALHREETHRA
ncbi:helix-turn-helix domain-containing protein [Jannaschia sp. R86511]|uniref:helix-turn-helix domain-containing protein n=1 Tax=Jannaschia sp. R86511 TaxID=3093853 RepID=UPI0036D21DF8